MKRTMKERERQEKKEATMRENVAEPNANSKRAARAESEAWTCKICDKEKNRNQYSKYQWEENRKKEAAVCLTCAKLR